MKRAVYVYVCFLALLLYSRHYSFAHEASPSSSLYSIAQENVDAQFVSETSRADDFSNDEISDKDDDDVNDIIRKKSSHNNIYSLAPCFLIEQVVFSTNLITLSQNSSLSFLRNFISLKVFRL